MTILCWQVEANENVFVCVCVFHSSGWNIEQISGSRRVVVHAKAIEL